MTPEMQKALETQQSRHEQALMLLCEKRKKEFLAEWGKTPLKLTFGMGSVYVEVHGEQANEEDYSEVEQFIRDLEEITDNYHLACPTDVEVGQ